MAQVRIALVSLGCAKNLVDSEWMLGSIREAGFETTAEVGEAEVVVVNTCAFIADATEESKAVLRELAEGRRSGRHLGLICAGCMSQRFGEALRREFPEIDALVGVDAYREMGEIVRRVVQGEKTVYLPTPDLVPETTLPRMVSTPPWTAYLKISEGCNHLCSFCTIPSIRGRYRSTPVQVLVEEARGLAERGVRELNLVSQDSTQYGQDLPGKPDIVGLLEALEQVEGVVWLRALYGYPTKVRRRLLEWMARSEKTCSYLDVPIQHVSESVLKGMRRSGSAASYLRLVERARSLVPDVTLRTTVIVGFPGETEADFEALCRFVEEAQFDRLGAFIFRAEEGTPAARRRTQVPEEVKEARYHTIMQLQRDVSLERGRAQVGKVLPVLVESVEDERRTAVGRSPRDAPEVDGVTLVKYGRGAAPQPGEFVQARITGATDYDLEGVVVKA